jgi:hypothetical protein
MTPVPPMATGCWLALNRPYAGRNAGVNRFEVFDLAIRDSSHANGMESVEAASDHTTGRTPLTFDAVSTSARRTILRSAAQFSRT